MKFAAPPIAEQIRWNDMEITFLPFATIQGSVAKNYPLGDSPSGCVSLHHSILILTGSKNKPRKRLEIGILNIWKFKSKTNSKCRSLSPRSLIGFQTITDGTHMIANVAATPNKEQNL